MKTLLSALFSHYRRHPLQLLALAVMIVVATMLWTGVNSLTQQARASLDQSEQAVAERRQVVRADGQPVSVADFVSLRRAGLCVMPWLEVEQQAPAGRVVGVDVLAAGCFAGTGPTNVGWSQPLDGKPFLDIGEAAALASGDSSTSTALTLLIADGERADALPAEYRITRFSLGPDTGELGESFLLNLDALGVLVLLITALLLRSVYQLGLAQRRDSFALLHRFGEPQSRIQLGLVLEIVALAALCVVPGVVLGRLLAGFLGSGFGQALDNLFDAPLYAGQGASWWVAIGTMMAVVSLVCLVGLVRLPPRLQGLFGPGPQRLLAMSAVVVGLLLTLLASSLTLVFVAVALVFVGVGLLTPALLSALAQAGSSRVEAPLCRWQFSEFGVLARRLALPLVALQFALAMVLAVQALVTVFESTFDDWLAQRLAAEYYIEVPAGADSQAGADWLAAQSELVATGDWHRVVRGRGQFSMTGDKAESPVAVDLLAVAPVTGLLTQWGLQASVDRPWQRFGVGGGVLINEQLARRYQIGVGQSLTLILAEEWLSLPVLAVYPDYGRPAGEIMLSAQQIPDGFKPGFEGMSINPGALTITEIEAGLQQVWQVDALTVRANGRIKALADAVFDQTFLLTRAMTVLTLVLAAAALLIMGWVFFSTRVWYYRLLAVWGLRDREVAGRLVQLAVTLTGGIALLALPLGIWLTWVLVHRINPLAFGWSLPMAVYPGFWLELIGLSLLVGLSIAVLMRRQLQRPVTLPVSASSLAGGDR